MIALRVKLNGKELCTAGADDLCVLSAIVNACGNLGSKTKVTQEGDPDLFFSAGGLTKRNSGADYHLRWQDQLDLSIGDKIEVELIEVSIADAPIFKKRAKRDPKKSGGAKG